MLQEIVKKISADSGLTEEEVMQKVDEKQTELSDLISEEGAAYIVAKELGVNLLRKQETLHIENLIPGMQNADILGKITKIFPVREFSTEKARGRVMNVIAADNTGSVRISLWNDEIDRFLAGGFSAGDVIHMRGQVRESMAGHEIRLGRFGSIAKSSEVIELPRMETVSERTTIDNLSENMYREVRAALLQVFESNVFYELCPQCKARLKTNDEGFICEEHGIIEPGAADYGLVITGVIDDGTASIRAVFFNEQAEKILGLKKKDAKRIFDMKKKLSAVLEHAELGKEFVIEGRARRNEMFDRLELIANNVNDVDVKKEIEMMLNA